MLCWVIIVGWTAKVAERIKDEVESHTIFLVVTVVEFAINTIILFIFIARLHERALAVINWAVLVSF